MKVLVTGADGYIGRGVVAQLISMGHKVVAYGLNSTGIDNELLEEHVEDIFHLTSGQIEKHGADAVLHLAWRNGFKHDDPSHIEDLPKHYSFIRSCAKARIPKIVCMGSMHEVGYHEGAVSADTPCWPTTPYAISKNALRELVRGICKQTNADFLWLRGFYLVSSDGRGDSIFSKLTAASRAGQKSFPFTSGKNKYDFLDYDEFCKQVVVYTLSNVIGVVNICSGAPESLSSRVERFIKDNKLNIELDYGAYPDRPYDSPAIWGEKYNGEII